MAKTIQLTRQEQQQFAQKLNEKLDRVTMSWDNNMRIWYEHAIHALDFLNCVTMKVPQNKFIDLFNQEPQGINMNIVMILCNNLEERTAHEMGMSSKEFANVLLLNHEVANQWSAQSHPIETALLKEFEIMQNKPKILGVV